MTRQRSRIRAGFSLVEVCLAVLVVGLGIMSVFSLFPTGLAASEAAQNDTETGLFAEQVLFGLQADATEASWDDWKSSNFQVPDVSIGTAAFNPEKNVAYFLEISSPTSRVEKVKEIVLYAIPWQAASPPAASFIKSDGSKFYTELYYTELPL